MVLPAKVQARRVAGTAGAAHGPRRPLSRAGRCLGIGGNVQGGVPRLFAWMGRRRYE